MTCIHVIHENAAWLEPLAEALDRQALPWRDWFFDRGFSICRARLLRVSSITG
jgi:hypothetical protein